MRDYKLYLDDILQAIKHIQKYTKGMDLAEFKKNSLVLDAVVRNLEVIGEASKKIPLEMKKRSVSIEWKKISGLRDILIHEYFGVDISIVWDVVENKLPGLKKEVSRLLR